MKHSVYLGLGSNLGDREETIHRAYGEIEKLIGAIKRQSAFYYSEPWGFESENGFANTVILVETELSPQELLKCTQRIERLLANKKGMPRKGRSMVNHHCPKPQVPSTTIVLLISIFCFMMI